MLVHVVSIRLTVYTRLNNSKLFFYLAEKIHFCVSRHTKKQNSTIGHFLWLSRFHQLVDLSFEMSYHAGEGLRVTEGFPLPCVDSSLQVVLAWRVGRGLG